jgi:hypothetical protein
MHDLNAVPFQYLCQRVIIGPGVENHPSGLEAEDPFPFGVGRPCVYIYRQGIRRLRNIIERTLTGYAVDRVSRRVDRDRPEAVFPEHPDGLERVSVRFGRGSEHGDAGAVGGFGHESVSSRMFSDALSFVIPTAYYNF